MESIKSPDNGQNPMKYRKYGLLMFVLVLIGYLYEVLK